MRFSAGSLFFQVTKRQMSNGKTCGKFYSIIQVFKKERAHTSQGLDVALEVENGAHCKKSAAC